MVLLCSKGNKAERERELKWRREYSPCEAFKPLVNEKRVVKKKKEASLPCLYKFLIINQNYGLD